MSRQPARRDEMGARIVGNGKYPDQTTSDTAGALLDMMRIGVLGEEITPEGVRVRTGRPRKYETPGALLDRFDKYIDYIEEKRSEGAYIIPDVEGFTLYAGITRVTLLEWEATRGVAFSNAIKTIKNSIAAYKKQLAMRGEIPGLVYAIDMNNNHGYVQQQTIDIKASDRLEGLPSRAEIEKRIPALDVTPPALELRETRQPETRED